MNFLRYDSPFMKFLTKVTDMIILNILCLLCSIPVFTFGAAFTAKYYVGMKIVKDEEGSILKQYFKSFKENFKQSTIIWLVQLPILVILGLDWMWLYQNDFKIPTVIFVITILITCIVLCMVVTIFPFIARFQISTIQAYKGALVFSLMHLIPILFSILIFFGSMFFGLWYLKYIILYVLFGTTASFYLNCDKCVKGFKKLEENIPQEEITSDEDFDLDKVEEEKEEEVPILRPDEHTLKGKINAEKETFKELDTKGKIRFFKDYYLLKTVILMAVIVAIGFFIYDAFIAPKERLYAGGLLYCTVSEDGRDYLTSDFCDILEPNAKKKEVTLSEQLALMLYNADENVIDISDESEQAIIGRMYTGELDYFLIDGDRAFSNGEKIIDHYMKYDMYMDITEYADKYDIPEEDRYIAEDGTCQGFILPEEVARRIGIEVPIHVYLVLIENREANTNTDWFVRYIFGEDITKEVEQFRIEQQEAETNK